MASNAGVETRLEQIIAQNKDIIRLLNNIVLELVKANKQ